MKLNPRLAWHSTKTICMHYNNPIKMQRLIISIWTYPIQLYKIRYSLIHMKILRYLNYKTHLEILRKMKKEKLEVIKKDLAHTKNLYSSRFLKYLLTNRKTRKC